MTKCSGRCAPGVCEWCDCLDREIAGDIRSARSHMPELFDPAFTDEAKDMVAKGRSAKSALFDAEAWLKKHGYRRKNTGWECDYIWESARPVEPLSVGYRGPR